MSTPNYGVRILPQHAEMLAASGITPAQAQARGYLSVDRRPQLRHVQITKTGQRVPGLLVPQLRADGSTWGYQYRPDSPRERDGKPVKYETPVGQRNGIDVPPSVGPMLGDPAVPLFITEGVKKADAGACAGLAVVALPGVWSWRGKNAQGGKVAVDDWHDVALNERRVVIAFDGDVARKPAVHGAMRALSGYLANKGAQVEYLHLPDTDDKTGLDDFLAEHDVSEVWKRVRPDMPQAATAAPADPAPVAPVEQDAPVSPGGAGTGTETGAVLDDVRDWLARYVVTLHDRDLDLLTLWAAHTHFVEVTYTTPRLVLDSPVPGSGKTTVLEHLQRLCLHPLQAASLSSPSLLTRMLAAGMRTILIDEADRSLSPDKEGVGELLAVLNSGYKRGASRPVLVPGKGGEWEPREMPTYSPVAMAGNNPALPEDTRSRCVRVLLMPDHAGEAEESDWELIEGDAQVLGQRLATWAGIVRDDVRANRPEMPEGVRGRARERWSPLLRVATAAGGRWPEVVNELAVHDVAQVEADREDGLITQRPHVALLAHLWEMWPEGETFWPTAEIVTALAIEHPDMWGEGSPFGKPLTAQRFGRMLATAYGVNSGRLDRTGPRGYTRASLERAWLRMQVGAPDSPAPPRETGASGGSGATGAAPEPAAPSQRTGESGGAGATGARCPVHGVPMAQGAGCIHCAMGGAA